MQHFQSRNPLIDHTISAGSSRPALIGPGTIIHPATRDPRAAENRGGADDELI